MLPDGDEGPRDDQIVAEVRATRERLAEAVGYDIDRLWAQFEALEAEERARGRTVLAPSSPTGGKSGAAA
jgi:hypothetical protein